MKKRSEIKPPLRLLEDAAQGLDKKKGNKGKYPHCFNQTRNSAQ